MNFRPHLEKVRNLPDKHKKAILWLIVAILAGTMLYFWFQGAVKSFSKIGDSIESVNIPSLDVTGSDELKAVMPGGENSIASSADDWKIYTNSEKGITISYPGSWSAGISAIFPNVVIFCPPDLSSPDPDVICKLKDNAGHADTQAPIILSLVQRNLQLVDNSALYGETFDKMKDSLKFSE